MRVGLIGCGRIGMQAHLIAYKKYGVEVVAVCDLIKERAIDAGKLYGIPYTYTNAEELASNPDVDLIDIATPPQGRANLLRSLYRFKKPMLIQKPLSYDYAEIESLMEEINYLKLKVAINHNARWSPVNQYILNLMRKRCLGKIFKIHHVNRFNENVRTWYTDVKDYLFIDHGLHYFDLVRQFTGEMPVAVSALQNKLPGQIANCALTYSVNLRFKSDLIVSMYFNNAVPGPESFSYNWYIDGEIGSINATLDSISVHYCNGVIEPMRRLDGGWVPDGFFWTYNALVLSILILY